MSLNVNPVTERWHSERWYISRSMTLVLLIPCSELFLLVVTLCFTTHIHLSLSTVCIPQTYPEYTLQIFQAVYKNALGHCWRNRYKIGTTRFSYFTLKKPILFFFLSCCCSFAQSCPTLCDPMDCSTPGFPVLNSLPEFAQTHVHWVSDAIQPSHPLSPPSPAFNFPQHQGLFQWVSSSPQVAKVLELQLWHQSFQWIFRTDFL